MSLSGGAGMLLGMLLRCGECGRLVEDSRLVECGRSDLGDVIVVCVEHVVPHPRRDGSEPVVPDVTL